jgi:hypothetical protein
MESKMKKQKIENEKFSLKEMLSIIFSIFALMISLLSFYYSNLRVKDNLEARILNIDKVSLAKEEQGGGSPYDLNIKLFFTNKGNRAERLMNLAYEIRGVDTINNRYYFPTFGTPICKILNDTSFILIQPSEVKIFDITIPSKVWEAYTTKNYNDVVYKKENRSQYWLAKCLIRSGAVNSNGDYIEKNPLFLIDSIEVNNYGLSVNQIDIGERGKNSRVTKSVF